MTSANTVSTNPLPTWQSHKVVEAAEIIGYVRAPNPYVDVGYGQPPAETHAKYLHTQRLTVPQNFFSRGQPKPGDFFVRYADGYVSWSPRQVFLDGNTRTA